MAQTLASLQLGVEATFKRVSDTRKLLTEVVEFFSSIPDNQDWVHYIFRDLREIVHESLPDTGIFFMNGDYLKGIELPQEFYDYSLGVFSGTKNNFYDRLVYPVRDPNGLVMGLCGWDPTSNYKYLDSKTYGYRAKYNVMYGMENLYSYYTSTGNVFIVEGIACCNYLRSKGYNSLALMGSYLSFYVIEILKRFGTRCVCIVDNDEAGKKWGQRVKTLLPLARVYYSIVAKDVDDTRRVSEETLIRDLNSLNTLFTFTETLKQL